MNTDLQTKLKQYLTADPTFRAIYDYTRQRFEAATALTAHNWEHAYRDTLNAIIIGEAEGADMAIVLPAAVMHDIGFLYGATGKTHGAVGADKLADYLHEGHIDLPADKLAHIAACIRTHKGSMHGEVPETLEAKVVSDADMLEKFGPIGVYQGIRTFTEFNYDAAIIIDRFTSAAELICQTATGQRLITGQQQFVTDFAQALRAAYQPYQETDHV